MNKIENMIKRSQQLEIRSEGRVESIAPRRFYKSNSSYVDQRNGSDIPEEDISLCFSPTVNYYIHSRVRLISKLSKLK